jgi:hypothetical protein
MVSVHHGREYMVKRSSSHYGGLEAEREKKRGWNKIDLCKTLPVTYFFQRDPTCFFAT